MSEVETCQGCGKELSELGEPCGALTDGSINDGFWMHDDCPWEVLCSDCLERVRQFISTLNRKVIVEIRGGAASLKEKPSGIKVEIIDYDTGPGEAVENVTQHYSELEFI